MAQSIRERIPELGILKTLGFSDGKVTALVLAEALLLLVLGGALGMGAAVASMPTLNGATGGRFPPLFVGAETWLPRRRASPRWSRSRSDCRPPGARGASRSWTRSRGT